MKIREIKNKVFLWAIMAGLIGTLGINSFQTAAFAEKTQELQDRLDREVQEGIAGKIFRLHVVANSDKKEDQELKMDVKKTVVDYLSQNLGAEADLEETREYVLGNLSEIEQAALRTIKEQGKSYPVSAAVEKTYFPDKTYGDCTFPAGEYEALNIRIGKGEGKNWWCVLYPSLCFIDDTWGVVSREKKEELQEVLTKEEFRTILEDPEEKKKVRIGFKWF
ncbi:MAG TPA: stage II sporulation protein R [Candidatus Blautia stercoripullorum]|uniref:Stage II sporulation protein R n=1 Tax=Candidatus Blautia stercoripullorum TaxID=2838502 RepID=A0A9D2U5M0_9FIRM|nr:stage II sporulation protein R [Candidatus Blautia stercoripullorum]